MTAARTVGRRGSVGWVTEILASYDGDDRCAHEYLAASGRWVQVSRDALLWEVQGAARGWRRAGVPVGGRVGIVSGNPRGFVPAFLGALWAGVVPVPLPPAPLGGGRGEWEQHLSAVARAAHLVVIAGAGVRVDGRVPVVAVTDVLMQSREVVAAHEPQSDAEVAYVQFSSGSTGQPRGIEVPISSIIANSRAIMVDALASDGQTDRGLSWLPLHHDMGLVGFVLAPLVAGVPVSFIPTTTFARDPSVWLQSMAQRRATISFAPNFAYALATRYRPADDAGLDLGHVRVLGCGAEPINPDILQSFGTAYEPFGLARAALSPCYGLAEATLAVTISPAGNRYRLDRVSEQGLSAGRAEPLQDAPDQAQPDDVGAGGVEVVGCGPPLLGHDVTIRAPDGGLCEDRRVGEIWVRGPSVARNYLDAAAAAGAMFAPDGWLHTGDLGYLADGELFVTGRVKDLLILHGRNIDPQRVEWLVETVEGVRAGGVVACTRPAPQSEELVIVAEHHGPRPCGDIATAIRDIVGAALGVAVHDVVVTAAGAIAKTTSGKPRRNATRRLYLQGAFDVG